MRCTSQWLAIFNKKDNRPFQSFNRFPAGVIHSLINNKNKQAVINSNTSNNNIKGIHTLFKLVPFSAESPFF